MKTNISLFILLFVYTGINAQILFTDDNVQMSYKVSKESVNCKGVNSNDEYYRKTINVWKVEVKLKNYSNKKLLANLNVIGSISIENWHKAVNTAIDCNNTGFKHGLQSKNNLDNAPDVYLSMGGSDMYIKPHETKIGYTYYDLLEGEKPIMQRWDFGGYKIIEKEKAKPKKKEKKEDDFWSGKKESNKTTSNTNRKDDFWSGGESNKKAKQNNDENFWSGKGNQKEEDYFKHNTKPKESNQFIGEINSNTKYIRIVCKDHGSEDGDRVALLKNKSIVESNIYLTNSPKTFKIQLKWGMNRIDFKALNQGTAGPNTAKFDVYDDTGKLISSKEWNLLTGFTGTLLITKF